jgi:O-antigen/teichoic acid export membrane protein
MRNLQGKLADLLKQYSFSLVSVASFGTNFIQSFIFAVLLDKESFGQVFLIASLFSTFSYLFVFGLDSAMFKFYFDDQFSDKEALRSVIFYTWLKFSAVLFLVLTAIGFVTIDILNFSTIKFQTEYMPLLLSGLFFSFLLIIQQFYVAARNIIPFALSTFGARVLLLMANLGVLAFGFRLDYFVYSYAIACSALFAIAVLTFGIYFGAKRSATLMMEVRRFSLPLVMNGIINGYRVLIASLLSFGSLAVYGLISQLAAAYYIGFTALLLPHAATAYKFLQENPQQNLVKQYRATVVRFGVPCLLLTLAASYFILKYFKSGLYQEGFIMLPILLIAQLIFALYSHEHIVLSFFKQTSRIVMSTTIGILLILSTFYFFVSAWQIWGACLVVLLGFAGQYVVAIYFRRRLMTHAK